MKLDIPESLAYAIVGWLEQEVCHCEKQLEENRQNAERYPDVPSFREHITFWTGVLTRNAERLAVYRAAIQKSMTSARRRRR